MFETIIIEPDNPGDETANADAAAAAAAGDETVSTQDAAIAAFDEAVEAVDEGAPAPAPKPKEEGDGTGEGEGGDAAGAGDGDGSAPAETDEQRIERETSERAAAAKAEDDTEVKALGLRGKAEERFRDMSGRIRDLSQKLEAAGGEDVINAVAKIGGKEGFERVVRDARDQREWDERLTSIGCTAEQFGNAIGAIAAFNSTDPAALNQAREYLLRSVGEIDAKLGKKSEHHDPLQAHPDLQEKVRKGAMDEEDALEVARLRTVAQQGTQRQQAATQQQQVAQAEQQGMQALAALGQELTRRDSPAVFQQKMAAIQGVLNAALTHIPPAEWVAHARKLYDAVPAPAPAQARPRIGKQPVRQSHATSGAPNGGAIHPNKSTDPFAAFDQGIEEAREAGL